MGKNKRKLLALILFLGVLLLLWHSLADKEFLTFAYLKRHHHSLLAYIAAHYARSVAVFILLFISTALVVPGAIVLTIAAGALFGTLPAVLLVNIGSVIGAAMAFLSTRYIFGHSLQHRYRHQLVRFNEEMEWHGHHYLVTLRVVPVLPAFVINCLAGLTKLPLRTFLWTTSAGVLPGSFVYAYAGQRLGAVEHPAQILTWPLMLALLLMGIFSLLPVIIRHGRRLMG